jgi:hypothetical protein
MAVVGCQGLVTAIECMEHDAAAAKYFWKVRAQLQHTIITDKRLAESFKCEQSIAAVVVRFGIASRAAIACSKLASAA